MEKEFKKGDYIVLGKPINSKGEYFEGTNGQFLENNCYKQKINNAMIMPFLDTKGSVNNSWSCYKSTYTNWRYATLKEATNYDKLNGPYDVRTLTNKTELNYDIY